MTVITVGVGQEYSTIAAAVTASNNGDTIAVQAGTYTNDFVTISHDLTLTAVGGTVTMIATEQPPDGKAIIDEGGSGVSVAITGFDISGVTVPDANGASIRYEGGSLTLNDDSIHDNQEGLLGADDANGTITIDNSTFANNGTGTGYSHNIYVGEIASLTVENSTITGAIGGHDIKSRAASTTIVDNTITDGSSGTASYEIDLPNGGNATVTGNIIEKGASATNPIAISYGEEGSVYASSSLTVSGNTMLNHDVSNSTTAVANDTSVTATINDNTLYGWTSISSGPATATGTTILATDPALSSLAPGSTSSTTTSSGTSSGETSTGSTTTSGSTTSGSTTSGSATTSGMSSGCMTVFDPGTGTDRNPWGWHGGSNSIAHSRSRESSAHIASGSVSRLIEQSGQHHAQQLLHLHS